MASMQSLDQLNASFAIPGILSFDQYPNAAGLTRARITTPACTAELFLQGAHLATWQPLNHKPALFLSERSLFVPGKAIRGGIPIIFPWFGARSATPESSRTDGPSHGFARIQPWTLEFAALTGDDLHLSLTLGPTDLSRSLGFDHFLVAYQLSIGRELRLRLSIANNGETPLHIEEALHTYFHVGDVEQARIHGLAGVEFLDKTDNFIRKRQAEPVLTLTGTTDRPYLDTTSPITVEDPTLRRSITVAKANSNTTVVWNPWANGAAALPDMSPDGWRQMLCIEAANTAPDALTLHPHEAHLMETTISLEALS
jgi:glucose-6-phosphate 1-epimerase